MANTTNFNWETPDDTDLVKDGAAAIRTLGNSIDTSFVDLKGGTTGQVLAKASNTDMDFTWTNGGDITAVTAGTGITGGGTSGDVTITNAMADAITTKGDLLPGTGADAFARLGVGANGTVLTADSGETTGLKWATPSSGSMTLLSTTTLSGSSTTISSISQDYVHLYIYLEQYQPATNNVGVKMRINGDTGSNYTVNTHTDTANGSSYETSFGIAYDMANDRQSWNTGNIWIYQYNNSNVRKAWETFQRYANQNAGFWGWTTYQGMWANTSAINSLTFFPTSGNWTGGTVKIYGVK